jgi:hypothetical protein
MSDEERGSRRFHYSDANLPSLGVIRVLDNLSKRISVQSFGALLTSSKDPPHYAGGLELEFHQAIKRGNRELRMQRIFNLDRSVVCGPPGQLGGLPASLTHRGGVDRHATGLASYS